MAFLAGLCVAAANAQQVNLPIPELHATAHLTFEPSATEKNLIQAYTIDCNGHHTRFLRKPENASVKIPKRSARFADTGIPSTVPGLSADPSHLFFVTRAPRTLLFFISEGTDEDATPLYVLGFHPDCSPYRVLVRNRFVPTLVESGPGNDIRITGKSSFSQMFGAPDDAPTTGKPYATTYDPFSVFVVHGDASALYSLPLTEAYNRQHYVWAGPHVGEDYSLVFNLPGHKGPVGATQEQATQMIDAANKAGQHHL